MPTLRAEYAIDLISAANARESVRARIARVKRHREAAHGWLLSAERRPGGAKPQVPAVVTLTRTSVRTLDDDNLAYCFKATRDSVAQFVGIDDGDPRLTWRYAQRVLPRAQLKTPAGQVRVTIEIAW